MISKKRKFPDRIWDLYSMSKRELGSSFLNTWYHGTYSDLESSIKPKPYAGKESKKRHKNVSALAKKIRNRLLDAKIPVEDMVFCDEVGTVKRVDDETARHLYMRRYNPLTIRIMCLSGVQIVIDNDHVMHDMKVQLHSRDDSSYGVWFKNKSLVELREIRTKLISWISTQKILNGEKLVEFCLECGGEDVDYN